MMISNKEKGLKFLNEMQAEHITKDHIFKSLSKTLIFQLNYFRSYMKVIASLL